MASLLKLVSSNVFSIANRGLFLQAPSYINTQIACTANVSTYNKIVQKLGIPEPPKKPMTGFIRFAQDSRDSNKASSKSQTALTVLAAEQWKQLSDEQKEKYNGAYKQEYAEYRKRYLEYINKLTPEQKKAIKAERKLLRENKKIAAEKKTLKDELRALGKPKKPESSFTLFVSDQFKNPNVVTKKASDLKDNWAKLSDNERQAYKQRAQQSRDKYEGELKAWEDKMMTEGKAHLIRKIRFLTKNDEEGKRRKKQKTE
ncbi:transcription factor A, mitochondrial-like [Sitodiplosis mosellana]|uniref:transcription factor A, mitochondrial-like n=1 Tax=Sitodiplosis mosellana TaxID=263140 RepID=UPI002443A556|nr:transcription factor A, mitochondrial-like [Sitodiplosis mosellana]